MRGVFYRLAILCLLAGFFYPPTWVGVVLFGILAAASPQKQNFNNPSHGFGVLDRWIDPFVTQECPFCKSKIPKGAQKCKHCGEWVRESNDVDQDYMLKS